MSAMESSLTNRSTFTEHLPGVAERARIVEAIATTGLAAAGLGNLLVEWLVDLLPASACSVVLRAPNGAVHRWDGVRSANGVVIEHEQQQGADAAVEIAAMEDGLGIAGDAVADLAQRMGVPHPAFDNPRAAARWISLPISHRSETIGRATVFGSIHYTMHHWESMSRLLTQFAFLFEQRFALERACDLAYRDEVTGLHNRRYLRQALAQSLFKARMDRLPVSIFLLDIDHFKHFNDTWGHDVGDRVLRALGGLMKSIFRGMDVVARYGGEEFAVLLCDHRSGEPNEHPREVLAFAERFRCAAAALSLNSEDGGRLSQITISGGIATYPWDAANAAQLIKKADEALYQAKRNGRNQIQLASAQNQNAKAA